MLSSLVITFREVLEGALVVVIVLSYLKRAEEPRYRRNVWEGVAGGLIAAVCLAIVFNLSIGGLEGRAEKIFEGVTMLLAMSLITWMIVWMMFQRHIVEDIEARLKDRIDTRRAVGISLLVGAAVLREGVETTVFLHAASFAGGANLLGAIIGAVIALALGYVIYAGALKIRIKLFFQASSAILILFAAGLTSHALGEFQEAGLVSPIVEPLYDISWLLDKKSLPGSILNSLFGYTGAPSLTEMIGYLSYFVVTYILYKNVGRLSRARTAGRG